jgi:hypothetical protein
MHARQFVSAVVGLIMMASVATVDAADKDYRSKSGEWTSGETGYKLGCSLKPELCQELHDRPSPRPEYTPKSTPTNPSPTPQPNKGAGGRASRAL